MKLIYDILAKADPRATAVATISGNKYTYGELWTQAQYLAAALVDAGLKTGECVALYSTGRPEWNLVDFAIQMAGGVVVSLFPGGSKEDQAYILNQTNVRFLFVGNAALGVLANGLRSECPKLERVIRLDEGAEGLETISTWIDRGLMLPIDALSKRMADNHPDQLVTIMYTSGTGGKPNGVMHSHRTLLAGVTAIVNAFPRNEKGWIAMSLLSASHCYERACQYMYFSKQMQVIYAESHKPLIKNLMQIKPQVWAAVPAVLQQLIINLKDQNAMGCQKQWALLDHYATHRRRISYRWQHFWADRRLYRKVRQQLGGQLERITVSGAALSPQLEAIFWGLGVPIFQIYGTTETVPITISSPVYGHKLGSSGPLVPGWQVRLSEGGEVEVKCPSCMLGVYRNPEFTKQVLTEDGWYRTGDIGRLEDNRFLYLEGRKSDSFKLSNGRYVSALRVESALAQSPLIRHALVQGPNQQHLTALLHVNSDAVDASSTVSPENLKAILAAEVARLWNNAYPHEPPIINFDWVLDDWTIETGAYTPTHKLKRKVLIERYKLKFNQLIHENEL